MLGWLLGFLSNTNCMGEMTLEKGRLSQQLVRQGEPQAADSLSGSCSGVN